MGFRGVLLRMTEGDGDSSSIFRVVAPDAELALPASQHRARQENALTASASDVVVVTDHVSARLLQVAGCMSVLLQRETHSALWVAAMASQKAASLVDMPSTRAASPSQARTSPSVSGRGLALTAWDHSTRHGHGPERRSCYCFQFRSRIEYELFERTMEALRRIQHMALLENSVLLELELERERHQQQQLRLAKSSADADKRAKSAKANGKDARKAPPPKSPASRTQGSAASRSVQRSRPMSANGSARAPPRTDDAARSKPRAPTSSSASGAPTGEPTCVLCGTSAPRKTPLTKHPFMLQDARGAPCLLCSLCMHDVLSRRVKHQPPGSLPQGARDIVCGLCAQPAATLKACALAACHRVYCTPCLGKLVGKAQSHKVLRTKHWCCPNCTNYSEDSGEDAAAAASSRSEGRASQPSANAKSTGDATRKRKRHVDAPLAASATPSLPAQSATSAPGGSEMAPVDYAANYFAFLLERECAKTAPGESEDVCFCCKDGGELIECDWPGAESRSAARCPKVYHEDCLGYKVPENFEWKCPRHRCQACGIIARYSCRFCVTSYCSEHVPSDVRQLGPATRDIPESTYVMCQTCEQHAQRVLSEGKLSTKTHAQLYRLPPKRK